MKIPRNVGEPPAGLPTEFCSSSLPSPMSSRFASSRQERQPAMSKLVTTGKRYLEDGRWHDDDGPLPDEPRDWEPPMTDEEIVHPATCRCCSRSRRQWRIAQRQIHPMN